MAGSKQEQVSLSEQKKTERSTSEAVRQWSRNVVNTLLFPFTQVLMAVGIFPAQAISTFKKIPIIRSIVGFITRKIGNDSRTAAETFNEDFRHQAGAPKSTGFLSGVINWFNKNPKAERFDMENLKADIAEIEYTTNFGRKVSLETFIFENEQFNAKDEANKYYRIHCSGNSGNCSRFFRELALLSKTHPELQTRTFNHPGVEGSGSLVMSQEDLVNALYAQVKQLIKKGAKPSHIELTGFSIGAATAALTAKKLKDEGIEVNLFCDRTLATLPGVVTDKLPVIGAVFKFLKAIPVIKELVQYVIQPAIKNLIVKPLLWLTDWNMNPAEAYKEIDPHRRALTAVKPKSQGEGWAKSVGKYFGRFTGFFKQGNGDKTIGIDVSLLTGTEDVAAKEQWKKDLKTLQGNIGEKHLSTDLLENLENHAENAITANAIERLRLLELYGPDVIAHGDTNINRSELLKLIRVGDKARRFEGTPEKDAHNVTADKIKSREKTGDRAGALKASGLSEQSDNTLLTYYSMFHHAVKNHNHIAEHTLVHMERADLNALGKVYADSKHFVVIDEPPTPSI